MHKPTPLTRVLYSCGLKPFRAGWFVLLLVLYSSLSLILTPGRASAATGATLNFQARLETATGAISADGNYNVQFKLYNVSSGGTALWTETYQNSNSQGIAVHNGYLTVNLGSITAFPNTINWDQDLWVTLNVGGTSTGSSVTWDGEMNPRLKLTAVPYAFRAAQLAQYNATTGYTSVLQLLQPTGGNQTFQLADQGAAGVYTLCIQNSANGCNPSSGSSNYIQNTTSVQSGANFNIGGSGTIGNNLYASNNTALAVNGGTVGIGSSAQSYAELYVNNLTGSNEAFKVQAAASQTSDLVVIKGTSGQTGRYLKIEDTNNTILNSVDASGNVQIAGSLDMTSGAALNIGGTNATSINLGQAGGATNINTTINGTAVFKTNSNATTALQLQNSSSANYLTANSSLQSITTKDLNVGYLATSTASRLFSDGFESNNGSLWDQGTSVTGSSTIAIDKAVVREGNYSAKVTNSTSGHAYVMASFAGQATATMRAYVYVSSQTTTGAAELLALVNGSGTPFRVIRDQTTGDLGFYNGVTSATTLGSTVLPTGSWHEIELTTSINSSTGSATLYLDGTNIQSLSNVNTGSSNLTFAVVGNAIDNQAITFNVDDVAVDTIRPGDSSSLSIADSLHVSGTSSFGSNVAIQGTSSSVFRVQDSSGNGYLSVDSSGGRVHIDPGNSGNGTLWEGLVFGGGSSGEGIASNRSGSGNNPNGLDFYTNNTQVFNLANNGAAVFRNNADSSSAFQVQNAAGTSLLTVKTGAADMSVNTYVGGFNINGVANPAAPTLSTSSTGGTLAAGTYYYRIAATSSTGSHTSAIAASPTSVTTTGSTSQNTLSWTAVTNANGYIVYRSTDNATWYYNTVSGSTTSIVDNGSAYTWSSTKTAYDYNSTGGINLQADSVLTLDGGTAGTFNAAVRYNTRYNAIDITNMNSGGGIVIAGDSFSFQDTTGFSSDMTITNTGATTFRNRSNSTTAFQIQNASGTGVLSVDTTNGAVTITATAGNTAFGVSDGNASNGLFFNPGKWWNPATNSFASGTSYFNLDMQGTGTIDISDNLLVSPGTTTGALQVQNASGGSLFNVDATNSVITIGGKTDIGVAAGSPYELDVANNIHICGNGTNCGSGQLFFGDNAYQYGSVNSDANNPWIGEASGDSDILMMSGSAGIEFQTSYTSDTYHYQSMYTESGDFCIDTTSCTHHLGVNGSAAASGGFATGTPDIAEYITTSSDVQAYDVVAADPNNTERVVKATNDRRGAVVGVISDGTSGFMMQNAHYGQTFDINHEGTDPNAKPMTLAGRIPVHVTNEGGSIRPGDYLTASSTPGYAMKATTAGPTVGKALGFFDGSSGTVLALINIGYYDPFDGNHLQSQSGSFDVLQVGSAQLASLNVSGQTTLSSLAVNGNALFSGSLKVDGAVSTGAITINGHIIVSGQAPQVTIGTALGSAKVISGVTDISTEPKVSVDGTDAAGTLEVVSGGTNVAGGTLVHLTFDQNYDEKYKVVISATNQAAADLRIYVQKTGEGFDVVSDQPLAAGSEYDFDYIVVGAQME